LKLRDGEATIEAATINRRLPPPTWEAFVVWAGFGFAGCFMVLVLGSIGLAVALALGVVGVSPARLRRSALGVLTGAGLPLLYVAWAQRNGPGTVCRNLGSGLDGYRCDQYDNPLPWLIVGLVLVAVGVAAQARRMRAASASVPAG
jgi:hypothetical protein